MTAQLNVNLADIAKDGPSAIRWIRNFTGIIALAMIAIGFGACSASKTAAPAAHRGSLTVLVRTADRTKEMVAVSEPGALPVRSGGAMSIDADLDPPAFVYLVWIDSEGKVSPLYPWNNETLEVKDISQPPPVRRPTKRIFSPLLGRSWTFSNHAGTETVLLLARATALPADVKLAELFLPPPQLSADDSNRVVEARLPNDSSKALAGSEAALQTFLSPLAPHFDLIHAVQFTHAEKTDN